jgi:hypothetical protein
LRASASPTRAPMVAYRCQQVRLLSLPSMAAAIHANGRANGETVTLWLLDDDTALAETVCGAICASTTYAKEPIPRLPTPAATSVEALSCAQAGRADGAVRSGVGTVRTSCRTCFPNVGRVGLAARIGCVTAPNLWQNKRQFGGQQKPGAPRVSNPARISVRFSDSVSALD